MSNEVDFERLWDYDRPADTEQAFRALLAETQGELRLQLLTQIARAQGMRRWTKPSAT